MHRIEIEREMLRERSSDPRRERSRRLTVFQATCSPQGPGCEGDYAFSLARRSRRRGQPHDETRDWARARRHCVPALAPFATDSVTATGVNSTRRIPIEIEFASAQTRDGWPSVRIPKE
jgi:hypothetical protein